MASSFMLNQASNPILQGIEGESSSSAWDQVCRRFSFDEIRTATRNFDEGLVVGKGGFGKVYEATLENGGVAAIKRLDYSRSTQGEPQFVAEIETLSKLRHCHLVSLIGYCNDGQEMILVYEFMPNGTLEQHRSRLSWSQRLKICLGAARGLDYLHTGTGTKHGVIHRDVKSSNILLDHNWDAKISDFGLSKIGPTNQSNSFVKTDIKGTFGYIDPCYFTSARLTRKSDVYSFGVVLFELLCGRAAVDKTLDEEQWGLAGWIHKCMRAGKLAQIVDSNIRDQISPKSLKGFVGIAARCLYNNPDKRPTMAEVVVKLAKIVSLQERTNSLPTKWTLKEKMFSLFPNRAPVISSPVAISDEKRSLQPTDIHFDPDDDPSIESLQVDFETIRVVTDNFSKANRVQQHSSSYVYKGRLQNGQGIAVEKFGIYSLQFRDDILSLMLKLRHSNVVRLLGYCVDQESNTLFLIYNFFPYASLDWLIYDHVKRACLDWHKLGNIIIRVAQGLHYIHEGWVLLPDFTPNKILLDESLEPKISGFESAWCLPKDKAHIDLRDEPPPTSLLNRGYHAPEEEDYRLSLKSNVYSFGSLLLEIIDCSRRLESYNISSTSLYDLLHAWIDWQGRNSKRLTDPAYKGDLSFVMRFIQIGLLCIQPDENDRPTMGSVVLMLTDSSVDLPIPKKPL